MAVEPVAVADGVEVEVLDAAEVVVHEALVLVLFVEFAWHVACSSFHAIASDKVSHVVGFALGFLVFKG